VRVRRLARILAASLTLPIALGDARAAAPPPLDSARDVVDLAGGGMVRGTIVEVLPGDSLAIVSAADGRTLRFPWAAVVGFTREDQHADIIGGVPAFVRPSPIEPDGPHLHVESTRATHVELLEITTESFADDPRVGVPGVRYSSRCVAPCDQVIGGDEPRTFVLAGRDITPSQQFTLSGRGGELVARVKPGLRVVRNGGIVALAVGVAGLATGGFLVGWTIETRLDANHAEGLPAVPANYTPATAVLVSSAVLVAGGLVMYLLGRTRVSWSQRRRAR
jgi:hypothetical protein